MLTLGQTLSYYKRKDVQKLMLEHATNKEIGVRFDESFGKRPDILAYDNDILESAKRGATSFHCSEELWNNPLQLNPNLRRNELDDLRIGWDLILDIDCPYWSLAKLMTYVFIKALKDHNISSITVKFSGSKGFHIGVPFESFPKKKYFVEGKNMDVKDAFPEGPRKIAKYLLYYIEQYSIIPDHVTRKIQFGKQRISYDKFLELTGKGEDELLIHRCEKCDKVLESVQKKKRAEYICIHCENRIVDIDKSYISCDKCNKIMEKHIIDETLCECGSNEYVDKVDFRKIIDVDTILISSRHMFRMPYSLHEKTGLVSVPFNIKQILKFDKSEASPEKFKSYKFLDRSEAHPDEAVELFQKAFDHNPIGVERNKKEIKSIFQKEKNMISSQNLNLDNNAIPEEFFPPCIKKISKGLEDGKKRALLVLINFLSSCNWEHDKIEEYCLKWNERNKPDQLKETYIRGQLRYYKNQAANNKEKMMPPNCDNRGYMIDTQFCNPDGLCRNIKNPVQYAKKRVWMQNNDSPKKRIKKEDTKKEKKSEKETTKE